ncbi:hypothetical protein Tco_1217482 [Tanacetum coccineum]
MDQLEKQLGKDKFQEIRSMAAFRVLETQCQKFIKSRISLDDEDGIMTRKYFLEYTQLEVQQFRDTLIQHMESVKKSIDERSLHKREYDRRIFSFSTTTVDSEPPDGSNIDITNLYECIQTLDSSACTSINVQGEVDQNAKQCHDAHPLPAKLTDNQTTELSNQSLKNQSFVLDNTTAFKSERPRILKPRFASQVDVNNDLSKPITTYYLPKVRESAVVKPHHVIASSKSRNSSKNMPRFSSNDMVHNHYLDEARKKTQEKRRNLEPIVMPSARLQSTANGSKPKPRINNQKSRNWPASKTIPTGKIFSFSTTTVDSEPPHGSNIDITNLYECIQTLDSSACTSINVQEERNLNLSVGTPSILKKERIKTCIKENVISGRPRLHGITLIQEISVRQSSQGIQSLLTS